MQYPKENVIVKRSTQPREYLFYTTVAPTLREADIPIPELKWSGEDAGTFWLVLEDIPTPLPRARWSADSAVLAVLRRLHQRVPLDLYPTFPSFEPRWSEAMTNDALACFLSSQAHRLASILCELQDRHQALFLPRCWISGDPNPSNWGLRSDGTVVLYDWERFGKGTPALDLAISVPGLGDMVMFQTVAARYLEQSHPSASRVTLKARLLADEMAIAKIWSVTEYLSDYRAGTIAPSTRIDDLIQQIPAWVDRLITEKS